MNAAKKYCKIFSLEEGKDVILHSKEAKEIEDYFSPEDLSALRKIALGDKGEGVTKKEFRAIVSLLLKDGKHMKVKHALLNGGAINKFQNLFQKIGLNYE